MIDTQRSGGGDRAAGPWRRSTWGRVWMAATLIVMDLALVAVASVAWSAVSRGSTADISVAAISILGASGAFGVIVLAIITIANLTALRADRAGRSKASAHRLASAGLWLALARLAGLLVATVVVAVTVGAGAVVGLAESCTIGVSGIDGVLSLLLALATARHVGTESRAR